MNYVLIVQVDHSEAYVDKYLPNNVVSKWFDVHALRQELLSRDHATQVTHGAVLEHDVYGAAGKEGVNVADDVGRVAHLQRLDLVEHLDLLVLGQTVDIYLLDDIVLVLQQLSSLLREHALDIAFSCRMHLVGALQALLRHHHSLVARVAQLRRVERAHLVHDAVRSVAERLVLLDEHVPAYFDLLGRWLRLFVLRVHYYKP